jgi:hypothetical protein
MRRTVTITAILITLGLSMAALASFAEVTVVMNSGERHSGTIGNRSGGDLGLSVGGQQRTFSLQDIAVIIYNDGDPTPRELSQLPTTDTPAAHERHTLVLRNGQVVRGTADDWKGDTLVFDTVEKRSMYNASDIARLYLIGGPRARSIFLARGGTAGTAGSPGGRRGDPVATIRVEANQSWTDTGLMVRAGERISFTANGTITVIQGQTTGPDGQRDSGPSTAFPVRAMPVGGLIARVGNSPAFAIGSSRAAIEMPAAGRLFLGVNDDHHADNSGAFDVQIRR